MTENSTIIDWSPPGQSQILVGSYVWKIDNFSETLGDLESPVISIGSSSEIKLKLHLFKFNADRRSWHGVYISVEDVTIQLPTAILKHGIALKKFKEGYTVSWVEQAYVSSLTFTKSNVYRITMLDTSWIIQNSDYFLEDNTLTIFYEMNLHEEISKCNIPPTGTITEDLKSVFKNQKRSDVKFLVDSQEFTAHKLIVCARSSVFSAMFDVDLKENQENQVKIDDVDATAFQELLRFMYTDEVEDIEKNAYDLLKAAHKYDLPKLKCMCEDQLCKSLNTENCTAIFTAADVYNSKELKQRALNCIVDNAATVMNTKGYNLMEKSHPHLISEAFRALVTKRSGT